MVGYGNGPYGGRHGNRGRDWKQIGIIAAIAVAAILLVVVIVRSGGRSTGPTAATSPSPTPDVEATTPAAPTHTPEPETTRKPPPRSTTEDADDAPSLTEVVPNVVGKDLQSAQEELFPPLRSTSVDATGQGRAQIVDSNWVVIRQEPAAGTTVPAFTDIKLFVVKQGESAR